MCIRDSFKGHLKEDVTVCAYGCLLYTSRGNRHHPGDVRGAIGVDVARICLRYGWGWLLRRFLRAAQDCAGKDGYARAFQQKFSVEPTTLPDFDHPRSLSNVRIVLYTTGGRR